MQINATIRRSKSLKICKMHMENGLGIDSRWCHWGFFPVATDGNMCPGVDSASKNEYQGLLQG